MDIISHLKLKNKIFKDQGATDNEGVLSVYESATDNDLMTLIGMKRAGSIHASTKKVSNKNLTQFL